MTNPAISLPRSLLAHCRTLRLGRSGTPALLIHPRFDSQTRATAAAAPFLVWMHGRTAQKELDNGRYLRLLRAGIATVALDLPGHGERGDVAWQSAERSLEVVESMLGELPEVLSALDRFPEFDRSRCAIGGFSLGGMTALAALCRPHAFAAALVEAASGDWSRMASARHDPQRAEQFEPLRHLDGWKPTSLLALHAGEDQMVPAAPQRAFIAKVRQRTPAHIAVRWHEFGHTGAPSEHIGFGSCAAEAKTLGTDFLVEQLKPDAAGPGPAPANA